MTTHNKRKRKCCNNCMFLRTEEIDTHYTFDTVYSCDKFNRRITSSIYNKPSWCTIEDK